MPTKTKISPDGIYLCAESFAGNDGLAVAFGERFRGDDPLVQRFPDRFVAEGELLEPPDKLREATPHEARHYAEHVERHKDTPLAAENVVECILDIDLLAAPTPGDVKRLGLTEFTIPAGSRFHRWSPVTQIPGIDHLFRAVKP